MNLNLLSLLSHAKHAAGSSLAASPQGKKVRASSATSSSGTTTASGTAGTGGTTASSGTGTSSTSSSNTATITANDFLTLLVTEIQNQDPTQQTDPMQYVSQLVGVNSLEQLIQINQAVSNPPSGSTSGVAATASGASSSGSPTASGQSGQSVQSLAKKTNAASSASVVAQQLPLASNAQMSSASDSAVAQALGHGAATPTQVLPPTQVPLSPDVMRALQHSIPGATFAGTGGSNH